MQRSFAGNEDIMNKCYLGRVLSYTDGEGSYLIKTRIATHEVQHSRLLNAELLDDDRSWIVRLGDGNYVLEVL